MNKVSASLTPQESSLAHYMGRGFTATRLTTAHQLGIANLTAVIAQLRKKKIAIDTVTHLDSKGNRYAGYELGKNQQMDLFNFPVISH